MHRLERRMAVKTRRDIKEGYDEVFEETHAAKTATPKRWRCSCDKVRQSSALNELPIWNKIEKENDLFCD